MAAPPSEGLVAAGLARLPAALHGEIVRFRRVQDQLARVVARLLLRRVLLDLDLAAHAGLGGWERNARGRPALAGCPADFSISHSGEWVVVAAGIGVRVGVDVECYRPVRVDAFEPLLTAAELARIAAAAHPERELLRCWSLREAVLKAHGCGLLTDAAVIRAIGSGRHPDGRDWWLHAGELEGACLTLAADPRPAAVGRLDVPVDELV